MGDTAVINDGEVTISGDITVAGLTFSGGVLDGPGTGTTLTVTDSLLLDGGEKSVAHLTLVNEGNGQWAAGNWWLRLPSGGNTQGQFHNASGATFEVSGGVAMINSSNETLRIVNDGVLIKTGSGLADFNSSFVPMVNRGTIDVQQGNCACRAAMRPIPMKAALRSPPALGLSLPAIATISTRTRR